MSHKGVRPVHVLQTIRTGPKGEHRIVFVSGLPGHIMAARVRQRPLRITVYIDGDATLGAALKCTSLVLEDDERDILRKEFGLPPWPEPIPGVDENQKVWPYLARVLNGPK
jgi:hypothetical protein